MKKITLENWLQPDPAHSAWKKVDPVTKQEYPLYGEDWVRPILDIDLSNSVPEEIRTLFEVARGAMVYGFFYYPLWSLAREQLMRVGEAAINHKANALDASRSECRFFDNINWLLDQDVISESESKYWHLLRDFRNRASHLKEFELLTPGITLEVLEKFVIATNNLCNKGV